MPLWDHHRRKWICPTEEWAATWKTTKAPHWPSASAFTAALESKLMPEAGPELRSAGLYSRVLSECVQHYTLSLCMCVLSCFSSAWLFATPWTIAQAPLSMGFSRQEHRSGLPCPQEIFPTQGSNPHLLCLLHCRQILTTEPLGKPPYLSSIGEEMLWKYNSVLQQEGDNPEGQKTRALSPAQSTTCWVVAVQSLSHVRLFATPLTAAWEASLFFIIFQSLLRLMSIELVMPSNHLIFCHPPLLLLPLLFPSIRSFPMSRLFASGGQNIGVSTSVSVLSMNIQGWFPLGLTGLISLLSKGLSRVVSSTTTRKY